MNQDEVIKTINSIKSKACGHDGISPVVVKSCAESLSGPLTFITNLCFKQGVFPSSLKVAKVVPLHKAGDKTDVRNKRPISILNMFSKIIEKCIVKRLSNYLEINNILHNNQHGFRKNHSTESAIIQFTKSIHELLESKNCVLAVYIDFSKAFDCLDHSILKAKLENIGIRGSALSLICNYLADRSQIVYYNNEQSSPLSINHGCVQGSQIGPLLFSIYINDVINVSRELLLALYADDLNALKGSKCLYELYIAVNNELIKLYKWVLCNGLSINVLKLCHMLFNYNPSYDMQPMELSIGGHVIPRTSYTKLLGVLLDENLRWNLHVDYVAAKISKLCGIVYTIRKKLNLSTLKIIYNSLMYPLIIYCVSVWGGALATHLRPVVLAQKRAVRAITNSPRYERTLPLLNANHLLRFHLVYEYFILLVVYKYLSVSYVSDAFRRVDHGQGTRGVGCSLALPPFTSRGGQRSILYQAPTLWNRLPHVLKNDLLNVTNILSVKQKLKTYLFHQQLNEQLN